MTDESVEAFDLPIKRTEGETLEDRLTVNAYANILPARYLRKDQDGTLVEQQEELFERVARNIALAEAVFEAERRDLTVTVTPEQLKPGHPRRDELAAEVFGAGTDADDDVETALTAANVNKFAYETVVPDLPTPVREHVEEMADAFQELMERLAFIPNSPTLMNAGDELQQLSACVAGRSPVYTRSGLKRMDQIEEGDEVLTHEGRYRTVTAHWSNGKKETVELLRGSGRSDHFDVQLTPDHEVLDKETGWTRADELDTPTGPTLPTTGTFPSTIRLDPYDSRSNKDKDLVVDGGKLKYRNKDDPRTPEFDQQNNHPTAQVANDENLAWLIGLYLADGDVDGHDLRFTLGEDETALRAELTERIEETFDLPVNITESDHGRWVTCSVSSTFVADFFATVCGTGVDEKRIPEFVGDADEAYQQAMLDALLDGDGTELNSGYRIVMANPTLVYETTLLARSLGYDAGFKQDMSRELSSRDTSGCYISTSEGSNQMDFTHRREAETVEVYDMEVEGDHSFAVGDFYAHNCFVMSPDDDLTDIHETATNAAEVFQSGGGCGYAFWQLRPYGDPVGSTGGIASGPITFMRTFDQMCQTIAQGGTRRGAQMGVMRVSHPDVIEFIHAKNKDVSLANTLRLNDPDDYTYTSFSEALEEARGLIDEEGRVPKHLRNAVEGHLSNFNISVGVTDGFMAALDADEEFVFTNPRTGEPHVATEETEEMYARYGLGEHVEPGEVLSVPAAILWERIIEGAHENGEPGVIYLERVNNEHSFDVDEHPDHRILATNPCVTGDTRISTESGLVPAEELYERGVARDVVVDGRLADDRLKEASSVYRTGEKDVYEVTTEAGYGLRLTADHRVMTDTGWVPAGDLEAGDIVHVQNRKGSFGKHGSGAEGRVLGWMVGDGRVDDSDERAVLNVQAEDAAVAGAVVEDVNTVVRTPVEEAHSELADGQYEEDGGAQPVERRIRSARLYEYLDRVGLATEPRHVPEVVMRGSEEMARGFLRALFTATGDIEAEADVSVRLPAADRDLLGSVQLLLLNFGIASAIREDRGASDGAGHELVLTGADLEHFAEEIGFLLAAKNDALGEHIAAADCEHEAERFMTTVTSVEAAGHEPVYDLTEPDTSSFVADGIVVHNCGEQPLEEYEACNLGHINLSTLAAEDAPDWRVWRDDHGDDALEEAVEAFLVEAIDWAEFDERIELGTRFLENVVTMSDFPVDEIEETVREMRKIGLGIMGLAQLYIQLGIRYGSAAGNEVARQLMVHINHQSKWTSHELAEERGSFAEWERSKYADPTAYEEWFEQQTGLDAEEWADGFPIRNHNSTTIAPTGTTSMVANTTGGCEPIYNVAYYKNVSDDVQGDEMLVEFDDYFLRVLEENDIDVEAVKAEAEEQMATNAFDGVEGLSTVPDAIGELFVITSDLSAKEHAAVQCACQAGVDSAISKTTNAPHDSTVEDAKEVFEYIYEHGGKGVTYYRDGTRSKQVLTTRADNAEFADMDEDEAAAVLAERIEEVFGDLAEFVDHETVRSILEVEPPVADEAETPYAVKQARPDLLHGVTQRIDTGYGKLYVTINEDPEVERPFELFATIGNSGGFTASFTEALAKTISTALRSGVDPRELADELQGIRSPKVAWDKGEQINSIPDAVGVALRRYLDDEIDKPYPQQQRLPEVTDEERATGPDPVEPTGEGPDPPEPDGGATVDRAADPDAVVAAGENPECPTCGSLSLYYAEGCKTCESCGWSEC